MSKKKALLSSYLTTIQANLDLRNPNLSSLNQTLFDFRKNVCSKPKQKRKRSHVGEFAR